MEVVTDLNLGKSKGSDPCLPDRPAGIIQDQLRTAQVGRRPGELGFPDDAFACGDQDSLLNPRMGVLGGTFRVCPKS